MATALVCEGGGMRGIYTAGVLDALLQFGLNDFDLYVGVSAGACNLASQLAGQFERNLRIFTRLMIRREFFQRRRLLGQGSAMDLDWLWETFGREEPLDVAGCVRACREETKRFFAVCTDATSGEAVYIEPSMENWLDVIKASSALPLLYRGRVAVEGRQLLDGGAIDPIPVVEAVRRGATRLVVIRTQPLTYRKRPGLEARLLGWLYRDRPRLCETFYRRAERYNAAVAWLNHPPSEVEVIHIAPPADLPVGRTTQSLPKLQASYRCGWEHAERHRAAVATLFG